jgi:hypothetical protein
MQYSSLIAPIALRLGRSGVTLGGSSPLLPTAIKIEVIYS